MRWLRTAIAQLHIRRAIRAARTFTANPPVGSLDLGDLNRTSPISRKFGMDRGTPIDRYYIEQFLQANRGLIHGRVLEFGDSSYTRQFGGAGVTRADVVYPTEGNPDATIVADLGRGDPLPDAAFDCVLATQVLPFIFDTRTALASIHRSLRPGGVLLATTPGISQISRYDMDRWGDYWRFTSQSLMRMLSGVFSPEDIELSVHGNVLSAAALLQGLSAEDLAPADLDVTDPDYEVVIAAVARRR